MTERELPTSTDVAGVDMRLIRGAQQRRGPPLAIAPELPAEFDDRSCHRCLVVAISGPLHCVEPC